jgi:hypothetical protein
MPFSISCAPVARTKSFGKQRQGEWSEMPSSQHRGYLTIKCLKLRDFVFGKWNFSENTGFFTYFPEMGNAEPLIFQCFITK